MCLCSPATAKGGFPSRCPVPDHVGIFSSPGRGGWASAAGRPLQGGGGEEGVQGARAPGFGSIP